MKEKMKKLISVIVPIYKVEKYLNRCVESIVNQTYKDLEIILVDDGSPDGCPQICDEYALKDSRIKVIHKENGGVISARQAGLRVATGDYVGFVDSDDYIEPDMYEKIANVIEKHSPDMVACNFFFDYSDKSVKSEQIFNREYYSREELEKEIFPYMLYNPPYYHFGVYPCCWAKVFKRELLEQVLYGVTSKIRIGEDAAVTYPCLLKASSLAFVESSLYHYRVNDVSMTKAYDKNLENTINIPIKILSNVFSGEASLVGQIDYYKLYMFEFVIRNEANENCKKTKSETKKTFSKFLDDDTFVKSIKKMDVNALPRKTKLLQKAIIDRSPDGVYAYCKALKLAHKLRKM